METNRYPLGQGANRGAYTEVSFDPDEEVNEYNYFMEALNSQNPLRRWYKQGRPESDGRFLVRGLLTDDDVRQTVAMQRNRSRSWMPSEEVIPNERYL